jgi:CRISPR-associated protein Cmr1
MTTTHRNPGALQLRAGALAGALIERKVRVVTLLHGGGPVASEDDHPQTPTRHHDAITPMRGSAVRGQLRFWWRATHGCTSLSVEEMRAREDHLWGNANHPGLVQLTVTGTPIVTRVETETLGQIGQGLRYGAFATKNLNRLVGELTVRCVVRLPAVDWVKGKSDRSEAKRIENPGDPHRVAEHKALVNEVEDAVTAWLLFGGIGGRTRRGFGAVSSEGLPDPRRFVDGFSQKPTLRGVPTLHGATVTVARQASPSAENAHKVALDKLREFRQGVGVGRNPGQDPRRPGRSRWPEPDTLRRIFNRSSPGHAPTHPVRKFPRAVFGLPIVFQFKDGKAGDPPNVQLVPATPQGIKASARMASPLILRPTPSASTWAPLALRLRVPAMELDEVVVNKQPERATLDASEAAKVQPLQDYGGGVDVIAAFLSKF